MPHIRIRGLSEVAVQKLSTELPKKLAEVMQTEIDNFTVEHLPTKFFKDGKSYEGDPLIEVHWFARGQPTQDASALAITEMAKAHTQSNFISVVFIDLPKQNYYENGKHF